jgi:UPF0755 protein
MNKRNIVVVLMLVSTILLSSFSFYGYQMLFAANFRVEEESKILQIDKNESFKSLQNKLYDDHYLNDLVSFSFLSKLMNYDKAIKPGRYLIKSNMNNLEVIRLLRTGIQAPVKITFNNIRLKKDLAERLTTNLAMSENEFNTALNEFIENNDEFDDYTIMSMFIPNTYEVYYNVTGEELINRMYKEFTKFWNEERLTKAEEIGLSPTQVVTLASIVNAESVKKEEGEIIAGLYMNRLKRDIALQADPTLVFASGDFSLKRVLNVHKEIESPYNTYKYIGLPPGPINMPPIRAIDAVLNYKHHNYLFMCAKEDFSGYHNFAETIREHINNANKYQRQLSIEQAKGRQNNK